MVLVCLQTERERARVDRANLEEVGCIGVWGRGRGWTEGGVRRERGGEGERERERERNERERGRER